MIQSPDFETRCLCFIALHFDFIIVVQDAKMRQINEVAQIQSFFCLGFRVHQPRVHSASRHQIAQLVFKDKIGRNLYSVP